MSAYISVVMCSRLFPSVLDTLSSSSMMTMCLLPDKATWCPVSILPCPVSILPRTPSLCPPHSLPGIRSTICSSANFTCTFSRTCRSLVLLPTLIFVCFRTRSTSLVCRTTTVTMCHRLSALLAVAHRPRGPRRRRISNGTVKTAQEDIKWAVKMRTMSVSHPFS